MSEFIQSNPISLMQLNKRDRIHSIIKIKNTRIIFSCDVTSMQLLCYYANVCGPYICILKVHTDSIKDFNIEQMLYVRSMAEKHNFLIMEDRKFGDIGSTLDKQITGFFQYNEWCDLVTAYPYIGQCGIDTFAKYNIGVFLLAELSINEGQIMHGYRELLDNPNNNTSVIGTIGQNHTGSIQATPGIHLDNCNDNMNQRYKTPKTAAEKGAELFIIGRAIYNTTDPVKELLRYKKNINELFNQM